MGRIIGASNGLVDGTTLQIPTSGYHTMSESAPLSSVRAFLDILSDLANLGAASGADPTPVQTPVATPVTTTV
jgi:hypothetical protein